MKRWLKVVLLLVLVAVMAVPVTAQEKKKREKKRASQENSVTARITKKLEGLNLTDEQKQKVEKIVANHEPKLKELADGVKITPEQRKLIAEARKTAAAEGKKGKELQEAVAAAANLSSDQKAARQKQQELNKALQKDLAEVLTPAQLEKYRGGKRKVEADKSKTKERKNRKRDK